MESASTTDDRSTEVAERKRLQKRERTADCRTQNDGTVYGIKEFNSFQYQNKLCYRFVNWDGFTLPKCIRKPTSLIKSFEPDAPEPTISLLRPPEKSDRRAVAKVSSTHMTWRDSRPKRMKKNKRNRRPSTIQRIHAGRIPRIGSRQRWNKRGQKDARAKSKRCGLH
jgi:hypothetical protein